MAGEKHLYLTFGGTYEDSTEGTEIWQFGVRCALVFGLVDDIGTLPNNWTVAPDAASSTSGDWDIVNQFQVNGPGIPDFDPMSYMTDQVIPAWETYLATDSFSIDCKATFIKIAPIAQGGTTILARTCTATANADVHGGLGGNHLPLQNSIAISTQTPVVGRRGRGRWYLPAPAVSLIGTKGLLASGVNAAFAETAATFLEDLGFTTIGTDEPRVRPIVTGDPYEQYGRISSVRVGSVVDTQRRRRDQLVESYASHDVTA